MVLPAAYFAQGAQLQISDMDPDTPTFTTIGRVGSITGPGKTRETIDVTNHDSPGGFREYIGGLRDSNEVSFDLMSVPGDEGQAELDVAYDADQPYDFQIIYPFTPDNETDSFSGVVTDLTQNTAIDDAWKRSVTIKITGPVERTNDA